MARETPLTPPAIEIGATQSGNYLAALVAGARQDTRAAAAYFREALRADPRNNILLERAFVASLSNGDMPQAFTLAERLVRIDPKNGLAQLALGVRAIKQRQFATARTHLSRGGNTRRGDVTAILLTAWAWTGSNDAAKAIEAADRLSERNFTLFRDFHAGLIAEVLKRPQEASRRMRSAYSADKNTLRLAEAYARLESRQGRPQEALAILRAFDEALPRHPLIVDAMERLEKGQTLEPLVSNAAEGAAEVLYGLGAAGARQGDEIASIIYLRLALHLSPGHGLAIISLGDLYERIKQGESAIEVYALMPAASPLRSTAELQIGLVLESLERKDEAQKHLEALVARDPTDPDALLALANLQRSRKQFAEAADTYSKALALSEKTGRADWTTYYFRGVSFERSKRWPQAEADFKKALEIYPDQPLVLNYLGYSWVDQGINLDEAFRMLRKAVDLRPEDGYIVDSLGWAYYRLGKYEDAVRELERAIELKPADPVINDHLGDAYWQIGRKLEARFQWNHARDLNPEPEDLPKILRKIEVGLEEESPKPAAEASPAKSGG
ncbi:MAG: tetratricopeptide repeat protein [Beijerinckiaceae bacterium]|nr:tetratricopeptide repeat protein [Beijerinckiaceae bacterium]